jgi:hypothetical protein
MQKSQFSGRLGVMRCDTARCCAIIITTDDIIPSANLGGGGGEEIPVAAVAAVETDWLGSDALLMGSDDRPGKMDEPAIV